MDHFIAVNLWENTVDLYTEEEFLEHTGSKPLEESDYESLSDRIEELLENNDCKVAWCRDDAIGLILDEIEVLSTEDGDGEQIIDLAKMIIRIAENNYWDLIIDRNRGL